MSKRSFSKFYLVDYSTLPEGYLVMYKFGSLRECFDEGARLKANWTEGCLPEPSNLSIVPAQQDLFNPIDGFVISPFTPKI